MDSKGRGGALEGYLRDILSQPDEFEGAFESTVAAVEAVLTPAVALSVTDVVIAGCGDSYCAAVAAVMAFERFAGVRTRALTSMALSRYHTALPMYGTAVIAISVSGGTARTVEGLRRAQRAGAMTIGVSANSGSQLAKDADRFVASQVAPADVHGPDARTYMSSLLVLLLAAIQLGEARGHLNGAEATEARAQLLATGESMRATLRDCDPAAKSAAAALVEQGYGAIVAVGAGPGLGSAHFAAAKIIEASGDHAWAQDGEEWAHIEYWMSDRAMPTILFAMPGRAYDRLSEQLETMSRIGCRALVVAPVGDPVLRRTSLPLPVAATPEEAFSPLVSAVAVELLSYYLVDAAMLPMYAVTRDDDQSGPSNRIRLPS